MSGLAGGITIDRVTEEEDRLFFPDMDIDEDGRPMAGPFNWTLGVRTEGKPRDIEVIDVDGGRYVAPTLDRPRGLCSPDSVL